MDNTQVIDFVESHVTSGVIPALQQFISIPSLSPDFDPEWETNGHMVQAMNVMVDYVSTLNLENYSHEILKEPNRPWLYFAKVKGSDQSLPRVLMYGHFDKQPHMEGWGEGLGPTVPVIKGDKLYGRGASDDGYAIPSSALIVKALQQFKIPYGDIFIIGENEEESDSNSLIYYVNKIRSELGAPDVVVCLDSGILTYDRLWLTTSLRGIINVDLTVRTLKCGIHSGGGSGVVPSTFRILEMLLARVEDKTTGRVLIEEMHGKIDPDQYIDKASTVKAIGKHLTELIPLETGVETVSDDLTQLYLNNTYAPTLVVTGIEGLPQLKNAGNVLQPEISVRLSFRIPPGVEASVALEALNRTLTSNPPYNAKVTVKTSTPDNGWAQKPVKPWLDEALINASTKFFGKPYLKLGEGGTIPFIGFLGEAFPDAQFIITGLLGHDSNAHSVDENLDIPYLKKLICCLIDVFSSLSNKSN